MKKWICAIIAMIRISGDLSLTETSQTRCGLGIRLEFCRKGRIATKPLEWCGCATFQFKRKFRAIGSGHTHDPMIRTLFASYDAAIIVAERVLTVLRRLTKRGTVAKSGKATTPNGR